MRRPILLAGVLPFVSAFLGSALALSLVIPTLVGAEQEKIQAPGVSVVDGSGVERVSLSTGPAAASSVRVLDTNGTARVWMNTGGRGGNSEDAIFLVFDRDGVTNAVRLGTGDPPPAHSQARSLQLFDRQGLHRIVLRVEEDGTPSIQLLDADGNVTWSAP
jgi:hypothetical protein